MTRRTPERGEARPNFVPHLSVGHGRHHAPVQRRNPPSRTGPIRPPEVELLPHRPRPRDRIAMRKYQ